MIRIRLAAFAVSTVEIYASEDWTTDAPEIEAVCRAWRDSGGKSWIDVEPSEGETVLDGLITLANTEDDEAERLRKYPRVADREGSQEQQKYARNACHGLSGAASRLAEELRRVERERGKP